MKKVNVRIYSVSQRNLKELHVLVSIIHTEGATRFGGHGHGVTSISTFIIGLCTQLQQVPCDVHLIIKIPTQFGHTDWDTKGGVRGVIS